MQNFFSVGRGDVPSWRLRTISSPEQRKPGSPQNKEGANSNNVKKTCYITDVDQQVANMRKPIIAISVTFAYVLCTYWRAHCIAGY